MSVFINGEVHFHKVENGPSKRCTYNCYKSNAERLLGLDWNSRDIRRQELRELIDNGTKYVLKLCGPNFSPSEYIISLLMKDEFKNNDIN